MNLPPPLPLSRTPFPLLGVVVGVMLIGCSVDAAAPRSEGARGSSSNAEAGASDLGKVPEGAEVAVLAGGCFWGMEEILRSIPGVLDTEVGYSGGVTRNPTYPQVSSGRTGHAEAVRIVFDPKQLSYETLLERWYFRMHDPTTLNRQGNDRGSNYRSAIFPTSPKQERTAREVIKRVDASGKWKKPVVTSIEPYKGFTAAEANHQDYLQKYPNGYTCHYLRN
ncbi:MAG TPA: peptide-methionine (S)-S-oxide reductase MsrA [Myxococcaceae bacterium]|nr:peptide-methionine (S)-S-oxide reductase MsrA [Myxococcaceae bacterium]